MKRFVSFSGPQMGVATLKQLNCGFACNILNRLIGEIAYFKILQSYVAPAGYLKDKYNYDNYLKYSEFLADINNERTIKNPIYKQKIMNLEKVLLVVNRDDEIVDPTTSGWFDYYNQNSDEILQRKDSNFYKDDYIGIRYLEENNRITFAKFSGIHTRYTHQELDQFFVPTLK